MNLEENPESFFFDDVHPSQRGSELIGRLLAKSIREFDDSVQTRTFRLELRTQTDWPRSMPRGQNLGQSGRRDTVRVVNR